MRNVLPQTSFIAIFAHGRKQVTQTGGTYRLNYLYPFGMVMLGRTYSNNAYRFGFNGMARDLGIRHEYIDFGSRCYDSRSALFTSIDPKYYLNFSITPFSFASSNPIRLIELNGENPGDPFASEEEALADFALIYNYKSIQKHREYSTNIYKYTDENGTTIYSYTKPRVGGAAQVRMGRNPDKKKGQELVAGAHTHGAVRRRYASEVHSPQDKNVAKKHNRPEYIVTPGGRVKKYDPATDKTTEIPINAPRDRNARKKDSNPNSLIVPTKQEELKQTEKDRMEKEKFERGDIVEIENG